MDEKIEEYFKIVQRGYNKLAEEYRSRKNKTLVQLPIFQRWINYTDHTPILELGCGSGFPVAELILSRGYEYLGVDISEKQIEMAKEQFPSHKNKFVVDEMLRFCQKSDPEQYSSVLLFFSMFHIPKELHLQLLNELKKILKQDGYVLFNLPKSRSGDSSEKDWLGTGTEMKWSNFSIGWYRLTLEELGFIPICEEFGATIFDNDKETLWYFLYQINKS